MPIYKYVTVDRLDIITNGQIRFTQPSAFNDPFEAYPYFLKIADDREINNALQTSSVWDDKKIDKMIDESLQNELKKHPGLNVPYSMLKDFMRAGMKEGKPIVEGLFKKLITMDGAPFRDIMVKTILSAIDKELGILCLTESRDNLLMWAHYTSNHTGFAIEFNEKHPFWDQRKTPNEIRGLLQKVRYSKERPEITVFDIDKMKDEQGLMRWAENIFWTKSDHWQYEHEWRMVYTLRDCQNKIPGETHDIYLFPIPIECITGLIIGCRMPDTNKQSIRDLLRSDNRFAHISISQAEIDHREYKLNFNKT